MRRRASLTLVAASVGWPRLLGAQRTQPVRIGLLMPAQQKARATELLGYLQQLGWTRGDNVEIEQRIGDTPQILQEHAAALVRLHVRMIVALLTPAVLAASRATKNIPIVIAGAALDPVGSGLAKSLAAPGGNVTGIVVPGVHLASKSMELVKELGGSSRRIGVLANGADPFTTALIKTIGEAARGLALRLDTVTVRSRDEYAAAFSAWQASRTDAIFVQPSLDMDHAAALALSHRLPSFSFVRLFVAVGGLMSYAANSDEIARRSADRIDRILRGADPARLPIEQPDRYDLTLNLSTARALGISVPNLLMLQATEIIE